VAEGLLVEESEHFHTHGPAPGDETLPLGRERRSVSVRYDLQYAYVVDGKTYHALLHDSNVKARRMPVHYDPDHPERNVAGEVTPPWIILVFVLGIGGLLTFFGYQFGSPRTDPATCVPLEPPLHDA
jgi:hypothetical protein